MFRHHSERVDPALGAARAEVEALLGRLGHDVSTLDDGGDAKNRQALADAAERYNTAGAQAGQAKSTGELAVARSIAVEGLHATRLVRTRLGLDPGPEPAAAPVAPAPVQPAAQPPMFQQPAWGGGGRRSGMGGALGAGMAGGLLGMLGGEMLGGIFGGGGDNDGGDWGGGDDGGGW